MITTSVKQISNQVEQLLIERGDWVSTGEICQKFNVDERQLRAKNDEPGKCTLIAISSNKGYKHVAIATTAEWTAHYHRERKHNIMGLVNLRNRRHRRESTAIQKPQFKQQQTPAIQPDTGQFLLPGMSDIALIDSHY